MEKNFYAVEFLLKSIKMDMNQSILANIINFWESYRCADGAENVYNLEEDEDLNEFSAFYGVKKTIECAKMNPYWIGGSNFKEPKMIGLADMYAIINDAYDIETLQSMWDDGYDLVLEQWFYTKVLKQWYFDNKKEEVIKSISFKLEDITKISYDKGIFTITFKTLK